MMDHDARPTAHPDISDGKVGVLLVNLGTPDATDYRSMRRYLKEFLSDRRVIELNPVIWRMILELFILPFRPRKSAIAYKKIWNQERDESPLRTITRSQAGKLSDALREQGVLIDWAMRYGSPSIAERIEALQALGCGRIGLFPLYPQYAAATTATANDAAFRALMQMRRQPALHCFPSYHDHPGYIAALAASVRDQIIRQGWEPQLILASFHGLPADLLRKGDPYYCHCMKTGRLLMDALGRSEATFRISFQSRFGPKDWLQPYTDKTLAALPSDGVRDVLVITPGFAADCVETLEEIALGGAEVFHRHGGARFAMTPCLNDGDSHIALLKSLILKEISGWIPWRGNRT